MDVQWGKHGNLPRNVRLSDLPRLRSLNFFYAMTIFGEPDILLGTSRARARFVSATATEVPGIHAANSAGRETGCGSVGRRSTTGAVSVFGENYSNKHWWP